MSKLRACVLGATGLVGQQFVRLLHNHPKFELVTLAASSNSAGKSYRESTEWAMEGTIPDKVADICVIETRLDEIVSNNVDIAFSGLPSDVALDIEAGLASKGVHVFSNAGAHRRNPSVPILIPEINPDHLNLVNFQKFGAGFIVTNSNCSTSGLVFGLKPLMKYGIKQVFVTTYQAISGAGKTGVASMDILGNVIPYIGGEEEKVEWETREILGSLVDGSVRPAEFDVNASCARVPVVNGHLESVVIRLSEDVGTEQIVSDFESFAGEPQNLNLSMAPGNPIEILNQEDRPQPVRDLTHDNDPHGMAVKIGRVRKKGLYLNFYLLVHNTMRGAAGASVLNAEYALSRGHLRGGE
ncbi:MAG: aspartate-semialdehyde dehydrogenase [Candidatus Thorarchaeota archaeon]